MARSTLGLIYTIEVDAKPIVAIKVKQSREAAEICKEEWLRSDLESLSSNGEPLCRTASKLRARIANDAERATYVEAAADVKQSDDILLVYLVELDGLKAEAPTAV
jgi:hypothetical protein